MKKEEENKVDDVDTDEIITYEDIDENFYKENNADINEDTKDKKDIKDFFDEHIDYDDTDGENEVEKAKEKIFLREKRKKRKKQIKISVLCVFSILLVFCILSVTVLFNIKLFEVNGSNTYVDEDIISTAGLKINDNLFKINKEHIVAKLKLSFPYIEDVKIKRSLPNKLVFNIKEAVEKSVVKINDNYVVLSEENRVLRIVKRPPENVTLILGVNIENVVEGNYINMGEKSDIIKQIYDNSVEFDIKTIKEIDVTDVNNISVKISDNRLVLLGDSKELNYKFNMYSEIDKKHLKSDEKVFVDCKEPKRTLVSPMR